METVEVEAVLARDTYGHAGLHAFGDAWEWRCRYCQCTTHCPVCEPDADFRLVATRDHYIPRSKGGSNRITNLVLACRRCNHKKSDRVSTEPIGPLPIILVRRAAPSHLPRPGLTQRLVWRACREGWHQQQQQAEASAAALRIATDRDWAAYRCGYCQHWHVEPALA